MEALADLATLDDAAIEKALEDRIATRQADDWVKLMNRAGVAAQRVVKEVPDALAVPNAALRFSLAGVEFRFGEGPHRFALEAPEAVWGKALQWLPERHHHSLFALRMRVPDFAILGDELSFAQHAHLARRVMEGWLKKSRLI